MINKKLPDRFSDIYAHETCQYNPLHYDFLLKALVSKVKMLSSIKVQFSKRLCVNGDI